MTNATKHLYALTLALITTLWVSNFTQAQNYYNDRNSTTSFDERNIRLGLSINPNIAWLRYNDEDYKSTAKLGFSYGLIADLGFTRNYYFSTGLLINSIASSVQSSEIATDYRSRDLIRLQYVDVPLTLKLKSEENNIGRFYGQFGFTAGIKVSGKERIVGDPKMSDIDKDDLFRLGLQIGGGAEWKLSNSLHLLTGLSFNNGFTRAINNQGKPKTSFAALNIGILF